MRRVQLWRIDGQPGAIVLLREYRAWYSLLSTVLQFEGATHWRCELLALRQTPGRRPLESENAWMGESGASRSASKLVGRYAAGESGPATAKTLERDALPLWPGVDGYGPIDQA